jgi:hypothetical protein
MRRELSIAIQGGFLMTASLTVLFGLWLHGGEVNEERNAKASEPPARALPSAHGDVSSAQAKLRLQRMDQMPLYFIENRGQLDSRVTYYVQGREKSLYFTEQGVTFVLMDTDRRGTSGKSRLENASLPLADHETAKPDNRWIVKLDFVGSNPQAKVAGEEKTAALVSYFKGPREQWKTGLPTWRRIVYSDLWPGIDLVFEGTVNRLKYSFHVRPGADSKRMRLAYRGATKVRLSPIGRLEVETPTGGFEDDVPSAYQDVNGLRTMVDVRYAAGSEAAGRFEYGFDLGPYDPGKDLVVDPVVLVYGGYIGGEGNDIGFDVAVDALGNAYVTGRTTSSEATFPVNVGPDLSKTDFFDAFVAKVKADGTGLVYAGYIGGNEEDRAEGIAVDDAGNAYVAGLTESHETTFPVLIGPDLTFGGPHLDGFVAKVNPQGTALVYAGYIGGTGQDIVRGIAVDAAGNAYVAGSTTSPLFEAGFPATVGPDLSHNGGVDAFVAKVNASGTGFVYAGYIGGNGADVALDVAVDVSDNAYVTGHTFSTEETFPVVIGPDLSQNGDGDAFVAKVNAGGTALDYAGYIGGSGDEFGHGIAVDGSGNAYVTGPTLSLESTFPVKVGPDLTYNGGASDGDAFVAKVSASGTGLSYAGYIGGSGEEEGTGVAVDPSGNAYITGRTKSTEATFPVKLGPDLTFNGGGDDGFVAKVRASGTGLEYAGYIGGNDGEIGWKVAVDGSGNAYITGGTGSSEATFPVKVGPDLTYNDLGDAYIVKVAQTKVFHGCGVGFWKQRPNINVWAVTGYSPNQPLERVFDVPDQCALDSVTLLDALGFRGGDEGECGTTRILLRTSVAALLNAAHPEIEYPLSTADVIAEVNATLARGDRQMMTAVATELDAWNDLGADLCGSPPAPAPTPTPP